MQQNKLMVAADENLKALRNNPYPGRCIIVGANEANTHIIQAYAIMGRSSNSRNRIFVFDESDGTVSTKAADPSKVEDPSLIIYDAMVEHDQCYAVSNGHQTHDALISALAGNNLMQGTFLEKWEYEPDKPNYTPRITAVAYVDTNTLNYEHEILIIKKSVFGSGSTFHYHVYGEVAPGFGHLVSTYSGDGDPLPSFSGEPYLVPLKGNHAQVTNTLWEALNYDNKVSLVVKFIEISTGKSTVSILNKYKQEFTHSAL